MAKLVFDIETLAQPIDLYDEAQQEYLFREAHRLPDATASEAKRVEIENMMSLWPLTSRVLCIAMLNADTSKGQVLFAAEDYEPEEESADGPVEFVACMDEAELLTAFWDVARHYDSIITFNGRGFDVPFIYLRSALLNIPISRRDWLGYRYSTEPHCDLAERGEHYDNHQFEIATAFAARGFVEVALESDDIVPAIAQAQAKVPPMATTDPAALIAWLRARMA